MKLLVTSITALSFFTAVSVASAATMRGTIKSIDTQKDTVTLQNGKTYPVPAVADLSTFKPGDKVKLTYSRSKGKIEISAISPAT